MDGSIWLKAGSGSRFGSVEGSGHPYGDQRAIHALDCSQRYVRVSGLVSGLSLRLTRLLVSPFLERNDPFQRRNSSKRQRFELSVQQSIEGDLIDALEVKRYRRRSKQTESYIFFTVFPRHFIVLPKWKVARSFASPFKNYKSRKNIPHGEFM